MAMSEQEWMQIGQRQPASYWLGTRDGQRRIVLILFTSVTFLALSAATLQWFVRVVTTMEQYRGGRRLHTAQCLDPRGAASQGRWQRLHDQNTALTHQRQQLR